MAKRAARRPGARETLRALASEPTSRGSGLSQPLVDLAGALLPLSVSSLAREISDRLSKVPTAINDYGFDPYGLSLATARVASIPVAVLYRYYFRVETHGIEHVPSGRVLLIANHAGQLPFDMAMVGMAMLLEADPPRIVRPMGEYWIPRIPFFNVLAARSGAMVGTRENCVAMLEAGECVVACPEGVRGMNKLWRDRYRLMDFGLGFMRLALQTDTPIVPVAVVGSEEQQPGLANVGWLAKALSMPAFPITPTFPWLGPLGLLPLPVKYRIYFGEALHFEGSPSDEDDVVEQKVHRVKAAISELLERGRRERRGVFSG